MTGAEMTWLIMYGGIALIAGIITLLDWLGCRQRERREREHKSRAASLCQSAIGNRNLQSPITNLQSATCNLNSAIYNVVRQFTGFQF